MLIRQINKPFRLPFLVLSLGLLGVLWLQSAVAQPSNQLLLPVIIGQRGISVEEVSSGFSQVTAIETAGDERLFIAQRSGLIYVMQPTGETAVFLDLTDRVQSHEGERGLLDVAFDHNFATNGYLYAYYSSPLDRDSTLVSRFSVVEGVADPTSELILLQMTDLQDVHNGGELLFHPLDGGLYLGTGDDWQPWLAQDAASVKGKLLRLDLSNEPTAKLEPTLDALARVNIEVIAIGLRNPWRFDVDPANGRLFIADVGNLSWEEINILEAGEKGTNFGWPCKEGPDIIKEGEECAETRTYAEPAFTMERTGNVCAIIGGKIWQSGYIFSDFCSKEIFWLTPKGDEWVATSYGFFIFDGPLTTFGRDQQGRLYAGTFLDNSPVYHFVIH